MLEREREERETDHDGRSWREEAVDSGGGGGEREREGGSGDDDDDDDGVMGMGVENL